MNTKATKKLTTTIIICIFFFLLLFIPFSLYIFSRSQMHRQKKETFISPSPVPTIITQTPTAMPTLQPSLIPSPTIGQDPQKRLLELLQNRQPLSNADLKVKDTILLVLPQGQYSGTVYQTADFSIQYIQSEDIFQVDILSTQVQNAKTEAETWFSNQGFSKEGICNLPIQFYLDTNIKNQVPNAKLFNPLPDGC